MMGIPVRGIMQDMPIQYNERYGFHMLATAISADGAEDYPMGVEDMSFGFFCRQCDKIPKEELFLIAAETALNKMQRERGR